MLVLFLLLLLSPLSSSGADDESDLRRRRVSADAERAPDIDYDEIASLVRARLPWEWGIFKRFKDPIDVGLDYGGRPHTYRLGSALGQIHMRYSNMAGRVLAISARHDCRDLIGASGVAILQHHQGLRLGAKNSRFLAEVRTTDDPKALISEISTQTVELGTALRNALYYTSKYISLDEATGRIEEHAVEPSCWDHLYWACCFCTWRCCRSRR